ncbi:hypothetical protein MKX96_07270 [Psychrobacillus sp. FSL W7-1493]|uniref:hypothetical protein n=1 Tax=Psychrobacillus sp. FSL W7-1493 TaxID=2921552 RepID=UPI0030FB7B72
MKIFWFIVLLFFILWIMISHQYPEPSWWSIFTSDRSTHTPLMEHLSLIKVAITTLVFISLAYLFRRTLQKCD